MREREGGDCRLGGVTFWSSVLHSKHIDGHELQETIAAYRRRAVTQQPRELLEHLPTHLGKRLHAAQGKRRYSPLEWTQRIISDSITEATSIIIIIYFVVYRYMFAFIMGIPGMVHCYYYYLSSQKAQNFVPQILIYREYGSALNRK